MSADVADLQNPGSYVMTGRNLNLVDPSALLEGKVPSGSHKDKFAACVRSHSLS